MTTAVATAPVRTRLPVPAGVDAARWRVLTEAIFPNARTSEAIVLAMDYCRVRGLDIMKKPVNIVPVWNSQLRREIETVWPAITEAQVTAARTHEWAGLDKPVYGETRTSTFKGRKKDGDKWVDASVTITYPEWCERTVYRMVNGVRCAFTERVYWLESYARQGGSDLPNAMWAKRPFDQFAKVAKAAALRAAFPEEEGGSPTAEEMHGQDIDDAPMIDAAPARVIESAKVPERNDAAADGGAQPSGDPGWVPPTPPDHDPQTGEVFGDTEPQEMKREETEAGPEDWRLWCQRLLGHIGHAKSVEAIDRWMKLNEKTLELLAQEAPKISARLVSAVGRHRLDKTPQP